MQHFSAYFDKAMDLYSGSQIQSLHSQLVDFLQKSPFVPRLANYVDVALFSFCYFTFLSFFIYYFLAPKLLKFESKPNATTKKTTVDGLNHGGSLRLKWAHMILSFIHATAVSVVSFYLLYIDVGFLSKNYKTRLFGFTNPHGNLFGFSMGYFLWDVCVCLYYRDIYGPSFLLHALMALFGILNSFNANHSLVYYYTRFLLFEASTIFVDMHWFLAKLGLDQSKRQKMADIMGLLSYLFVRMGYGYFSSYELTRDLLEWYQTGQFRMYVIVLASMLQLLSHTLNLYWFFKLTKSALGSSKPTKVNSNKKQN